MKKIYLILAFLTAFIGAYSQTLPPTPGTAPRSNSSVIPEDYNFSARSIFLIPRFSDTTAANTYMKPGFDSCGRQIFTYVDNNVWVRACSPKRWISVGSASAVNIYNSDGSLTANRVLTGASTFGLTLDDLTDFQVNDDVGTNRLQVSNVRTKLFSPLQAIAFEVGDSARLTGIGTSSSTNLFYPLINPNTGAITKIAASGVGTNIYNSDGTIQSERDVHGDGNNINWHDFNEYVIDSVLSFGVYSYSAPSSYGFYQLNPSGVSMRYNEGIFDNFVEVNAGQVQLNAEDSIKIIQPAESATLGANHLLSVTPTGGVVEYTGSIGAASLQEVTTVGNTTTNGVYIDRKDTVGTRFGYDWTTGVFSSWTDNTSTATVTPTAGVTTVSGGALNLNNSLNQQFYIGVENFEITQKIIAVDKNNTSFGFGVRLAGTVGSAPSAFFHFFLTDTTTNGGYISYTTGNTLPTFSTSPSSKSNYNFLWNANDTLLVTIRRINRAITATLTNVRTGGATSLTIQETTLTVAQLALFYYGGTWGMIGNFNLSYNEVFRPFAAFLGDSNQWGVAPATISNKYVSQVMSGVAGGYVNMSAPFEQSLEGWYRLQDVNQFVKPTIAVWAYGVNDRNSSVNIDSFSNRTQRFVRGCLDSSIQVALVNLVPQTSGSVVTFNDTLSAIATRYGVRYIDIYSRLVANSGTAMNALYNSGDGVHLNVNGQTVAAAVIRDALSDLMIYTAPLIASPLPTEYNPAFNLSINSRGELVRTYADSSNGFIRNIAATAGVTNVQSNASFNIGGSGLVTGDFRVLGNGNFASPNFYVNAATAVTSIASLNASSGHFTSAGGQTSITSNWLQFQNGSFIRSLSSNTMRIKVNISGAGAGSIGVTASTEGSVPSLTYRPFAVQVADSNKALFDRWGGLVTNWNSEAGAMVQFKGDSDTTMFVANASTDRIGIGILAPEEKLHVVGRVKITDMPASTDVDSMVTVTAGRLNTIAATNWGRTASTGITNSTGTWTANLSTGVSGGQSLIGGTAANDQLLVRGSTVASGSTTTNPDVSFISGDGAGLTAAQVIKNGTIAVRYLTGTTAIGTMTGGTGAGTSPTLAISGTDLGGTITVTTDTDPVLSQVVVTVNFGNAFPSAPKAIILSAGNSNAAALSGGTQVFINQAAVTTGKFDIVSGSTALGATTQYVWYYSVIL